MNPRKTTLGIIRMSSAPKQFCIVIQFVFGGGVHWNNAQCALQVFRFTFTFTFWIFSKCSYHSIVPQTYDTNEANLL